jgi:glycosyltransferase involved in cell wall biosynthesis
LLPGTVSKITMKVTAITVCWNSEAALPGALASLRAQTWPDIQMVIVDGGSTDSTVSLARAVAREGDVIVSERDTGIYNAMNKGLSLATGELIYFLNSDDRLSGPDVVASIVARAVSTAADIVIGDVIVTGGKTGPYRKSHAHIRRWNLLQERICHQAAFVRRSVFERYGGFDERYSICADHEFFLRATRGGATLHYLREIVADFRLGGASSGAASVESEEIRDIVRRYQRPFDVPLLLAYRAARKAYRTVTRRWLNHRSEAR